MQMHTRDYLMKALLDAQEHVRDYMQYADIISDKAVGDMFRRYAEAEGRFASEMNALLKGM